ncbi:hypothetical protein GCM10010249_39110 [Streptomyces roseolilacinus]|uniref:Uncharacterized protein n=1 Tax=Streptomyces roseolilacinus TaxID=66904 RepID=A0A918EMH1_9ACTN|nr:hypothetical protein GCM10010249_39110 [Streptomyces roseolilacinus]
MPGAVEPDGRVRSAGDVKSVRGRCRTGGVRRPRAPGAGRVRRSSRPAAERQDGGAEGRPDGGAAVEAWSGAPPAPARGERDTGPGAYPGRRPTVGGAVEDGCVTRRKGRGGPGRALGGAAGS